MPHSCFSFYHPSKMGHHQRSAPLEIVPLPASHTPIKSKPKLLADILRMVMELLLAIKLPEKFLFPLRFVSKEFNALILPLLYRHTIPASPSVLLLVSSLATWPPIRSKFFTTYAATLLEPTMPLLNYGTFVQTKPSRHSQATNWTLMRCNSSLMARLSVLVLMMLPTK